MKKTKDVATLRDANPSSRQRIKCSASAVIKQPDGQPLLDSEGKKQYRPCANWAMQGTTVCHAHGGKAPRTLAKAEQQLREARDSLMAALLAIARDTKQSAGDRLKAITWALERAGFKNAMEIQVGMSPWQQMLRSLAGDEGDGILEQHGMSPEELDEMDRDALRKRVEQLEWQLREAKQSPGRQPIVDAEFTEEAPEPQRALPSADRKPARAPAETVVYVSHDPDVLPAGYKQAPPARTRRATRR